jgi:hypothetical protein
MLEPEKFQVFQDWMQQKLPHFRCPACGGEHFEAGAIVLPFRPTVLLRAYHSGDPAAELQVTCANCALMLHFDARLIGIFP